MLVVACELTGDSVDETGITESRRGLADCAKLTATAAGPTTDTPRLSLR